MFILHTNFFIVSAKTARVVYLCCFSPFLDAHELNNFKKHGSNKTCFDQHITKRVSRIKIMGLVVPWVARPLLIAVLFILSENENFYQSINKQNVDTGAYTSKMAFGL